MTLTPSQALLRIAHGYGNNPDLIKAALEQGVDVIEGDVRLRGKGLRMAHDRRLFFWWLLFGRRRMPPLRAALFRRGSAGAGALPLDRLPAIVDAKSGLLLDLKAPWLARSRRRFINALLPILQASGNVDVRLCGNWALLDAVRQRLPDKRLYYSIADRRRWQAFVRRLEAGDSIRGISLHAQLFDSMRSQFLRDRGIDVLCWPVDTEAEARRVMALGAAGIISYDLTLLAATGGVAGVGTDGARR